MVKRMAHGELQSLEKAFKVHLYGVPDETDEIKGICSQYYVLIVKE